jgi:hypothetical protein
MAAVLDAASNDVSSGSSHTFSKTCTGTATNGILLVAVTVSHGSGVGTVTPMTCTYGGVSMTEVRSGTASGTPLSGSSATSGMCLFYLLNPAAGAANIVVTYTGNSQSSIIAASSYINCGGIENVASTTSNGAANSPTLSITSARGSRAFCAASHGDTITGVGTGTNERTRRNVNNTFAGNNIVSGDEAGAATVDMDFTSSVSDQWVMIGLNLRAVAIVNDTEDVNTGLANLVFSEPAGLAVDDLLLACLASFSNVGGVIASPGNITGFTSVVTTTADDGTSTIMGRLTRRVADGTEGPTYTSVIADGTGSSGKLLRITGVDTTNPVNNTGSTEGTGTTLTFPVVAVVGTAVCLAVAMVNGNGDVSGGATGWTLYDAYDGVPGSAAIYYKTVSPGQSTNAATIGGLTSDTWSVDVVLIAAAHVPVYVTETTDDNGAGGDISFTEPASLAIADLLLADMVNYGSGGPNPGLISGFNNIATVNGGVTHVRSCWRVADGTEGPTYTSTVAAPTDFSGGEFLHITDVDPTTPIHNFGTNSGSSSTLTLPSVANTSGLTCLAVAYIAPDEAITADPAGWNVIGGAGSGLYWKYVVDGASSGAGTATAVATADYSAVVVLVVGVLTTVPPPALIFPLPIRSALRLR